MMMDQRSICVAGLLGMRHVRSGMERLDVALEGPYFFFQTSLVPAD